MSLEICMGKKNYIVEGVVRLMVSDKPITVTVPPKFEGYVIYIPYNVYYICIINTIIYI